MDRKALKQAEKAFLREYPGGFEHPELAALAKKHKMNQHEAFARESFAKARFDDPPTVVADMVTLVSRSGMVSMFEKPKFKTMGSGLGKADAKSLSDALYELLHGAQKAGFEALRSCARARPAERRRPRSPDPTDPHVLTDSPVTGSCTADPGTRSRTRTPLRDLASPRRPRRARPSLLPRPQARRVPPLSRIRGRR